MTLESNNKTDCLVIKNNYSRIRKQSWGMSFLYFYKETEMQQDAIEVKLISSDYLGLEEEDVWRAVLNWAKYQVRLF